MHQRSDLPGACSYEDRADGTLCDDGLLSTRDDACAGGVCTGIPDLCAGVSCDAPDACHAPGTCDPASGACSVSAVMPAGTSCGPDQACDDAGHCFGAPTVIATSPAEGDTVSADTPVSVTFDQPMDAAMLRGSTTIAPCMGTIQVRSDRGICWGFTSEQPEISADRRTATFTPAPGLLVNRQYTFHVTAGAHGVNGLGLLPMIGYRSATGFRTENPLSGNGSSQNESDGPGEVAYCALVRSDLVPVSFGHAFRAYGWVQDERYASSYESLLTQVGYGPTTANPEYEAGWVWITATYRNMVGTDAEYSSGQMAPAVGTYALGFRVSLDGGTTWTYCDRATFDGGAGSGSGLTFDLEDLGQLVSL